MKVDVCIATFRRPQWLALLLQDLAAQALAEAVTLRAIVVDNDPAQSARAVVEGFASDRLTLHYLTQPVKNIALTRNAALEAANADWLAFVDDDESVPPHWLQALLDCQRRFDADGVFGPLQGRLEATAPQWVRRGGFFDARRLPTGTELPWGSTNNALLRGRFVAEGGARFDARFGLTGGEDTHFFVGLSRRGARFVWCHEATVSEHVPAERTTLRWLLRRNFRGGQSFADIVERPHRPLPMLAWALRRAGLLLASVVLGVLSLPLGAPRAMRYAIKAAANAGQLSTLLRFRLQEYR